MLKPRWRILILVTKSLCTTKHCQNQVIPKVNIQNTNSRPNWKWHQYHCEQEILSKQGDSEWCWRDDFSQQQEEHSQRYKDGNAQRHLMIEAIKINGSIMERYIRCVSNKFIWQFPLLRFAIRRATTSLKRNYLLAWIWRQIKHKHR